jgi:hypothetical protein
MKLFNMDLHISVINDFKNIFPEFDITNWCLSGHAWVFSKQTEYPNHINPSTWININEEMIANFQNEYDHFLRTFDGFICGHPNSFISIFEKYEKPIIMINSCRYDLPFCYSKNYSMLQSYKNCLKRLNEKGLLIAVSNNKADQEYTRLGCGIETTHIPSLCGYTGIKYYPTRNTFLGCGNLPNHPLITPKHELGNPYKWSDISNFKGIVIIPYEISTMSMFEYFSAGMPLFFPSKKLMIDNNYQTQSVSAYWGSDLPSEVEIFSNQTKWLDLADFYEVFKSPNVYIYDSNEHLIQLLETFQWRDDREILENYKNNIRNSWVRVIKNVFKNF